MNLEEYLTINFLRSRNLHLIDIYTNFIDTSKVIELCSNRILRTLEDFKKTINQMHEEVKKSIREKEAVIIDDSLNRKSIDEIESLRADIRIFFVFVRALMDNFCKIIKINHRSKGDQLPLSMNDLLKGIKNEKYKDMDEDFSKTLSNELDWFIRFRFERDGMLHKLHAPVIIGDSRGISFQIGKHKDTFGTEDCKPIDFFIKDVNKKVESFEEFLMENMDKIDKKPNF